MMADFFILGQIGTQTGFHDNSGGKKLDKNRSFLYAEKKISMLHSQ